MIRVMGEDVIREAARRAAAPFTAPSGEVRFGHAFRYVTARR